MGCINCFWRLNRRNRIIQGQTLCLLYNVNYVNDKCDDYIEDRKFSDLILQFKNQIKRGKRINIVDINIVQRQELKRIIYSIKNSKKFLSSTKMSLKEFNEIIEDIEYIIDVLLTSATNLNEHPSKFIIIPTALHHAIVENNLYPRKNILCKVFNISDVQMSKYSKNYYKS